MACRRIADAARKIKGGEKFLERNRRWYAKNKDRICEKRRQEIINPSEFDKPADWVEPTPSEIANGWTAESLNKYLHDRGKAQLKDASKAQELEPPTVQNSKYNPHLFKW